MEQSTQIQTYGWKQHSNQMLFDSSYFDKSVREWGSMEIFDYPGIFIEIKSQKISFKDVSFRENRGPSLLGMISNFLVKGDFLIEDELIGRYKLIDASDYCYSPHFLENFKNVLKNHNYKITEEEQDEIREPLSKALTDWANQKRGYKEKNIGIPWRVFLNYGNQKEFSHPKPILEIGFENIVYFQDETFANLYILEERQTLIDKFGECYKVLRGDLFRTGTSRSSSKRHNLKFSNRTKNLERLIKIGKETCEIPEELENSAKIQELDLPQEIKRLANYLKTQPLVECS